MKFGVVVFPGSNCDADCFHVAGEVLNQDAEYLWHKRRDLNDCDAIILPGGFSYGDYLRCGAIAQFSPIMPAVVEFANNGGLVIGICNGFQILLEVGLLPGAMLRNKSLKFICKNVYLKVKRADTPFTNLFDTDQVIQVPIAHGEGNYFCDEKTLKELQENKQILFTYCNNNGDEEIKYNPNGSVANIAGITNKVGNVLGMMPHPERCAEEIMGTTDGRKVFASMLNHLQGVKK